MMMMRRYGPALACLIFAQPAFANEHLPSQSPALARAEIATLPILGTAQAVTPSRQSRQRRAARAAAVRQAAPMIVRDDRYVGAQPAGAAPVMAPPAFAPALVQPRVARTPAATGAPPASYAALVSRHAAANGVPESLVHRVIMRESRYNPRAVSKGNYGMMQIRLGTARAMGYTGSAAGLLDANTNMTYAVKYLAGAYRVAGGNHGRAVSLYASGYYYHAKRRGVTLQQATAAPNSGFALSSTDGFSSAEGPMQPRRRGRR